jgi:catechol 2,3-dioxygenase-like lactoylglutathione lyase family enzyme
MTAKLRYAIEFVGDMDRAVKFYRDVIGLPLKFESPEWSEFSTGETTLALHPASDKNPAARTRDVTGRHCRVLVFWQVGSPEVRRVDVGRVIS